MKKKTLIISSVVVLAVILVASMASARKSRNTSGGIVREMVVEKQNIVSSIKGNAAIMPKDQYSITSLVSGDVIFADFEEGDTVEKGQLLYQIDSKSVEKNISSADVALRQATISYNEALKNKNDLYVKSDTSGTIKTLYVKLGDMVASGTKIAEIYDDRTMELVIPFNQYDIQNIYVGAAAEVRLSGNGEILNGTVTVIHNASYVKAGNMLVQDVKIVVNNPGTLSVADTATAQVGTIFCNDVGTFQYKTEKTVLAKTSGEVVAINIDAGNYVNSGQTIVTLKNESLETTIHNHSLSLENSQISKSKAVDALENYIITAPISGTVVTKNLKQGDKLDTTNASTPMAVIYDLSLLKFDLNVDELDINRIALGQEVTITADALEGRKYTGYIRNISINANVQSGSTTYPVTVEITEFDEFLLPGMNVDVEIIVERADDVIAVPVSSVERGNIVYVKGEKTEENDNAPEGFKSVTVTTGIYNNDFIEIKSGLNVGDIVYRNLQGSNFGETMQRMMGAGGPPQTQGGGAAQRQR